MRAPASDAQFAAPAPASSWTRTTDDAVRRGDCEVGNKQQYAPRAWGKGAEAAMAARVVRACQDLRSAGTHQA